MIHRKSVWKDIAKETIMLIVWCCMHPFAFVLPLALALGAGVAALLVAVEEWRAKK